MWQLIPHLWPIAFLLVCLAGGWLAAIGCMSESLWPVVLLGPMPIWWACRHFRSDDISIALLGAAVHGITFSATIHVDLLSMLAGYLGPIWFLVSLLGSVGPVATVVLFRQLPDSLSSASQLMLFGGCWTSGEWMRYLVSTLIDRTGNQSLWIGVALVAEPILAQFAEFGGATVLGLLVVSVSAGLTELFFKVVQNSSDRSGCFDHPVWVTSALLAAVAIFGFVRMGQAASSDDRSGIVTLAACCPPVVSEGSDIPDGIRHKCSAADLVVFPEGFGGTWAAAMGNPSNKLTASNHAFVYGAIERKETRSSNLAITKDRFGVLWKSSKVFPVPIIECQPGWCRELDQWFLPIGVFPIVKPDVIRRPDLNDCPVLSVWEGGIVQVRPAVCYDVFFPAAHWRSTNNDKVPPVYAGLSLEHYSTDPRPRILSLKNAQLRAIENRAPYVRSSAGGVCAVIDRCGRIVARDWNREGNWTAVVAKVHTRPVTTWYSQYGEVFAVSCGVVVAALIASNAVFRRRVQQLAAAVPVAAEP